MGEVTVSMVKELRGKTGAGMMNCKEALKECNGDFEKSVDFLRKKGVATATQRSNRETSEGIIQSYIHMGNKIGVIVEINCETDFVAKTSEFSGFARNIAMHIAATNPVGISSDDVHQSVIEREKEIYRVQALETGKPEKVIENIVQGKLDKFFKENCLMNQQYVKETDKTISNYLNEVIARTGEKITVKRFSRFQVGEA